MYCEECGQALGHGHATWCNTLKPGYESFADTLRHNLDKRVEEVKVLEAKNRELQEIVDAAVDLVKWHGAGALKGDRYLYLFSVAGAYHLKVKPNDESSFPTAGQMEVYRHVQKFFNVCHDHKVRDCRTCAERGVFCLEHRKVMVEGICPKCIGHSS